MALVSVIRRSPSIEFIAAGLRTDGGRIILGWEVSVTESRRNAAAGFCNSPLFVSGRGDGAKVPPDFGCHILAEGLMHSSGSCRNGVDVLFGFPFVPHAL